MTMFKDILLVIEPNDAVPSAVTHALGYADGQPSKLTVLCVNAGLKMHRAPE